MEIGDQDRIRGVLVSGEDAEVIEALQQIERTIDVSFLPEIIESLDHEHSAVRCQAAATLAVVGVKTSIEALLTKLESDKNAAVRIVCASALRQIPTKAIQEALGTSIYDDNDDVVVAAIYALVGTHTISPVHQLASLLEHGTFKVRLHACIALTELRQVTPVVIETISRLRNAPEADEYDRGVAAAEEVELSTRSGLTGMVSSPPAVPLRELLDTATEIYTRSAKVQLKFSM
jgi:HEAT repeat protein